MAREGREKCSGERGKERSSSKAGTLWLAALFSACALQQGRWDSTPFSPDTVLQEASCLVRAAVFPGQSCPCLGVVCDSRSCLLFFSPGREEKLPTAYLLGPAHLCHCPQSKSHIHLSWWVPEFIYFAWRWKGLGERRIVGEERSSGRRD